MTDTAQVDERFRVVIYGFAGTSAAGWFRVEPVSGRLGCYRELVEKEAAPAAFARKIVQQDHSPFSRTIANPEVFKAGKDVGAISEVFTAQQLYCQQPEPEPETAIACLQDYLQDRWLLQPDGTEAFSKLLIVTRECPRLAAVARRALRETEDACALVLAYACASRNPREIREVNPKARALELEEQGTWEREEKRRERDRERSRRRRP